jgi:hypothetical protein
MLNYTERLTRLMQDVAARVPLLSFLDLSEVLVFARAGRSSSGGAFATCHCLSLPASDPEYYYWRDRASGHVTRRSEWFVTRSPVVTVSARPIKYLVSFALPRFCDQSLVRSPKERFYPGAEPWLAKLDTVVHELYHIDPEGSGIRQIKRRDGTCSAHCHGHRFFEAVAALVVTYLASRPNPAVYDFLLDDFDTLERRCGGVVGTTFRGFPSFPQRYIERLERQPASDDDAAALRAEPVRASLQQARYTEEDLCIRRFWKDRSRRLERKGQIRAA